jgi:catechol 2,3-dioxygenase-like lactoylglutathione lyase family enzyme
MLTAYNSSAVVAVHDLAAAREFYEKKLGLTAVEIQGEELVTYQTGNSKLSVYRSQFAGTNQATAVSWEVGDAIEGLVAELKAKGIVFEHYEMPNTTLHGDIHEMAGMKTVWFKDPGGNLLNLLGR